MVLSAHASCDDVMTWWCDVTQELTNHRGVMRTLRYLLDADTLVNEVCVPSEPGKVMKRLFKREGTFFVSDLDDSRDEEEPKAKPGVVKVPAPRLTTV